MDGIYYWTGRGLNWDAYGHNPASTAVGAELLCTPDGNGYNTGAPTAINYFEWCADHDKPLEANPFGDVAGGGPVSLPDPNIMALGAWYGAVLTWDRMRPSAPWARPAPFPRPAPLPTLP